MRHSRRLTQAIVDKLDLKPSGGGQTGFERLVDHVCELLDKGDPWIVHEFWDRIEGKPRAIAVEDAMEFARHLVDSVRRHVTDPVMLAAISKDMQSVYQWKPLLVEAAEEKTPERSSKSKSLGSTSVPHSDDHGSADLVLSPKDPLIKKLCKPTDEGTIEVDGPKAWEDW